MASPRRARDAGADAVAGVRQQLAVKAAELLRRNPDRAAQAVEVGLVDRSWLEEPGEHRMAPAPPLEVVQRFLERSVEQEPSLVARLGLSALQMLSWNSADDDGSTVMQPVSVVFTDLEGYTRFTSQQGDVAAQALVTEHHKTVGPIVRSRGGRVVKRLGDGLMLAFPSPEAAVLGALDLVEEPPAPLRLRAGVHLGTASVTEDDLIGNDINVTARVAASAKGGQVLATVDVRSAVVPLRGVEFGRARRRSFKGLDDVVLVCAVTRSG